MKSYILIKIKALLILFLKYSEPIGERYFSYGPFVCSDKEQLY